jgi:hypothetical protein
MLKYKGLVLYPAGINMRLNKKPEIFPQNEADDLLVTVGGQPPGEIRGVLL